MQVARACHSNAWHNSSSLGSMSSEYTAWADCHAISHSSFVGNFQEFIRGWRRKENRQSQAPVTRQRPVQDGPLLGLLLSLDHHCNAFNGLLKRAFNADGTQYGKVFCHGFF